MREKMIWLMKGKDLTKEADQILAMQREEIEKGLLTDINGKDTEKAETDLKRHNLSSLFSYRQAYFVGAKAQLLEIHALFK